jgi:hypothetical protein
MTYTRRKRISTQASFSGLPLTSPNPIFGPGKDGKDGKDGRDGSGVYSSPTPPEAPTPGQLWQEVSAEGVVLHPWPWTWDASLGKWLSTPFLMNTQSGRATGNVNAAIGLTYPLPFEAYAKEIRILLSKNSGERYGLSFRKVLTDDAFGPNFLSLSLSDDSVDRLLMIQPISESLGDCHALDYTLTVPQGGNARATIQVVTHAVRPSIAIINNP